MSWAQYEALLAMRGESCDPRLTYVEGVVELMTLARSHERTKTTIARLLETWASARDVGLFGYGSWTVRSEADAAGVEADECYVVAKDAGDAEARARPDLAIEVAWTPGGVDKLEAHRRLRIGEVWVWRKGRITVHVLDGDAYRVAERSVALPDVDVGLIAQLAASADQPEAVRGLMATLRARR